jgi:hypothetical protein
MQPEFGRAINAEIGGDPGTHRFGTHSGSTWSTPVSTGDIFSSLALCSIIGRDATAVIKTHNLIDTRTMPRHRFERHPGAFQRHRARREGKRLRKQLTASLSDHRQTHASLQRVAITRDLSPTHAASSATGGSSRRACAATNCSPCASLNNQSAALLPRPPGRGTFPTQLARLFFSVDVKRGKGLRYSTSPVAVHGISVDVPAPGM